MLYIEHDDDGGCFRLVEDDRDGVVGLCTSKSRRVLERIRDALNAVGKTSIVGHTVRHGADSAVVLDSTPEKLAVRRADGQLHTWPVGGCKIVEPERPSRDTPSNEPAIGVRAAVELLERWVDSAEAVDGRPLSITDETKAFLAARRAAEPIP